VPGQEAQLAGRAQEAMHHVRLGVNGRELRVGVVGDRGADGGVEAVAAARPARREQGRGRAACWE
jgi:hypothetical protein